MIENKTDDVKNLDNKYIKDNWNEYEQLLIIAINDSHATMAKNIFSHVEKVNPNKCVNDKGTTLLHWVAGKKDIGFSQKNILSLLLEAGANPLIKDFNGLTALDIAKIKKHTSNMDILEKGMKDYENFLIRRANNSKFTFFKIDAEGKTINKEIDLTGLDMYESILKVKEFKRENNF